MIDIDTLVDEIDELTEGKVVLTITGDEGDAYTISGKGSLSKTIRHLAHEVLGISD